MSAVELLFAMSTALLGGQGYSNGWARGADESGKIINSSKLCSPGDAGVEEYNILDSFTCILWFKDRSKTRKAIM